MKYIEYTGRDTYYSASIVAVSIPVAHATYEKEICEFDDGIADFVELSKEEFVKAVAETISEKTGEPIGMKEAEEQLSKFENDFHSGVAIAKILGIDRSLI